MGWGREELAEGEKKLASTEHIQRFLSCSLHPLPPRFWEPMERERPAGLSLGSRQRAVLASAVGLHTWLVGPARSGSTLSALGSCQRAASRSRSLRRPSHSSVPKVLTSGARGWKGDSRPGGTGPGVSGIFKVVKNHVRHRRKPHFLLPPTPIPQVRRTCRGRAALGARLWTRARKLGMGGVGSGGSLSPSSVQGPHTGRPPRSACPRAGRRQGRARRGESLLQRT